MSSDDVYNKLLDNIKEIPYEENERYGVQQDRISDEMKNLLAQNKDAKQLYELYLKTFYKGKKRAFIISPEFQKQINDIVLKIYNVNESVNSLYLIKQFTDLYEELCEYDCILTLNNRKLYEGKITDELFEQFTNPRTVCKILLPNDKVYVCTLHENESVKKLQQLLENNSLSNFVVHNKAMFLANELPLYNILIESELDETTQSNIKKYGINYKKIIESIICNNKMTE